MSNIRIIARLDVKSPNMVKGIHLEGLRKLGNPHDFAKKYYHQGIDEIIYMDISFEQINAFQAVSKEGSFSRAGESLYRTQSAVSIQVARLEASLGQKLFHRRTKGIDLTEAGEVLLRYVTEIKQLLAEAEQELVDLQKMERGPLWLLIGPEGGFSGDETRLLADAGSTVFSLGRNILRTETAALIAAALILYEMGEI